MTDRIHAFARKLRQSAPDAKQLLWQVLRDRRLDNIKFRRQHPIETYIVDFCCLEKMLIIQVDGDSHLYTVHEEENQQSDLESLGFRVLRFWNEDVLTDLESVVRHIHMVINEELSADIDPC